MKALRAIILVTALLSPVPAAAQVSVTFVEPERYTDAESHFGSGYTLRVTLAEIRRLFTELGDRALRPGESLSITALDIDLAGYERPGAVGPDSLRIVSDVGPPRLRLRYTLKERDRTVLAADETVTDIDFLSRYARSLGGASFAHERELIRDWLQTRIAQRQPPRE
ncbi:DUF3016 domain-containing protein [Methylobacterium haplocladii]|uniref:DUF3016 domain-containing protein n=1 Tax=Methylobacterium haplocladii TaxID=1176176 RepID=A0A512ILT9_9HYPH|nr:DUF3016 domain-containing protein [Methylobacterium haplocladii]GEO98602.1 hypothetical protein MHA02_09900 [Methylobacterium haplocladii]GJD83997.1 hypothetical protein HPGCJGGD_1872 [Methylobacterium haplocladii]GLS59244.1 hypothetical protein GCM10007887_19100 [Methylobacterium haplocladii]